MASEHLTIIALCIICIGLFISNHRKNVTIKWLEYDNKSLINTLNGARRLASLKLSEEDKAYDCLHNSEYYSTESLKKSLEYLKQIEDYENCMKLSLIINQREHEIKK